MPRRRRLDRVDHKRAAQILRAQWKAVVGIAESKSAVSFVDDASLRAAITKRTNHSQVSYRYCLPIQLLGKLTNSNIEPRSVHLAANESEAPPRCARSVRAEVI